MIAKHHFKTRGIVLRTIDYSDADRIVSFITEDMGKITGMAKGARKSQKRFANALEPFTCLSVLFSRRKGSKMSLVEETAIVDHHSGIRDDLEKSLTAAYFMDLANQFILEGKRQPALFHLLDHFLNILEKEKYSDGMIRFFELRFLRLAGYEPMLDRCSLCNRPIQGNLPYFFSPSTGSIRCRVCYEQRPLNDSMPVSMGTIRTMLLGKDSDLNLMSRILMTEQCARECRGLLSSFIRYLLGKELKSLHVLNDVRRMGL
ncbi:MAG: DNA repair protein RecO [Syntrophales bacterium]|jgi:DNA repair protein RecO (recombination protein O)|nr:DNA repair protein RecO [Syntrophales bacterium]NLN60201.1 DNA repair protein RecO [Deltaproteobacteria bacterium]